MLVHFLTDENKVAVDVVSDGRDWRLSIEGAEIPLQAVSDGRGAWLVETHQGRRRFWVAVRGDERLLFCDGKVHTLRLFDPEHEQEDDDNLGGPNLTADMPGKVVQVTVSEGQEVAAGQTVLIIESMKMETELSAAVAGTVGKIHVTSGQVVGQGAPLIDIQPGQDGQD